MPTESGTACLCAIARDEHEADLREWVCYHLGLGFNHVTLYDNGSRRPLRETLAPLLTTGAVSVVDFPQREAPQLSAYFHALRLWRGRTFWLAFLDIDEFLTPLSPPPAAGEAILPRLLRPYERFGGLVLHWMMMGPAGHEQRPPGATLCNYREALGLETHVKSIVRPECVVRPLSPHHFAYAEGLYAVNEDGFPVVGPESYPTARHLRVNHYYYKSRQDFADKIARGLATPVPGGVRSMENFLAGLRRPARPDDAVLPWLAGGAAWAARAGWPWPLSQAGGGREESARPLRLVNHAEMRTLRELWRQLRGLTDAGASEDPLLAVWRQLVQRLAGLYQEAGLAENAAAVRRFFGTCRRADGGGTKQTCPPQTAGGQGA